VSPFSFGVPNVFGGSEGNAVDLAGEMAAAFGLRIVENHFHCLHSFFDAYLQKTGPSRLKISSPLYPEIQVLE
jgi:hypothetical protein